MRVVFLNKLVAGIRISISYELGRGWFIESLPRRGFNVGSRTDRRETVATKTILKFEGHLSLPANVVSM